MTLEATTARPVTFTDGAGHIEQLPAGTAVYVTEPRNNGGYLRARVRGTLLCQDVTPAALVIP